MANDLRLLDPKTVVLRADAFGRLWLREGEGEEQGPVQSFRAQPLTNPTRFISLQTDEGEELGLVPDIEALDPNSRAALERHPTRREQERPDHVRLGHRFGRAAHSRPRPSADPDDRRRDRDPHGHPRRQVRGPAAGRA
jgi:hypothetical protein